MKTAKTKICLIIGDPVDHSLSPLMHNTAYSAVGIEEQFVYLAASVPVSQIEAVVAAVKMLGIVGLTCTMPHKTAVIPYLDEVDTIAKKIGAVNSIVNKNGVLKGYNTDWIGAVTPLKKRISLIGKKILVLGAGGAARAVVYGLVKEKANVTIVNRTFEKAKLLANEFECNSVMECDPKFISSFDVIFNTTSLGMKPNEKLCPVDSSGMRRGQYLMDAVYFPYETEFLKRGKKMGATIIHGLEMLLYQGVAQFELYTGKQAPVETMRTILLQNTHI